MDFRYLVAAAVNVGGTPEPAGAPTLVLPLGTTLSETSALLSVITNKTGGILYYVVTASATPPSAAQVKDGQNHLGAVAVFSGSQAIAVTGSKSATASALVDATTYYAYFMHEDALAQQSNVAASASFLTGDVTAPVLTAPTASAEEGETEAFVTVTTDSDDGTLYAVVTTSSTAPSAAQVKLGQNHLGAAATFADDQVITTTGTKSFDATGLTLEVTYYTYFMHEDAATNQSTVSAADAFTTTLDTTAPVGVAISPLDGATGVNATTDLVITFSEAIQAGSGSVRLYLTNDTLVEQFDVGTAEVVISGTEATCNPTSSLTASAGYYVQITPGAFEDLAGNPHAGITDETSWNFTVAAAAAPIVANQGIEFGALTRTGAGGVDVVNTGGPITSVTIDSGNTGTDWKIVGTQIVPNQNGGLTAGPYALGCTFTNASGSDTATITITTSGDDADGNDLATSWSVSTHTECYAAAQNAAIAFGDTILCRTGSGLYNPTHTGNIQRPGNPVGTWTAPSLYDEDHPDKGYDLDTGNFVKITKHAGASPIWGKMSFTGPHHATYFRVTNMTFNRAPLATFNPLTDYTGPAFTTVNLADMVAIDNCEFYSNTDEATAYNLYVFSGITISSGNCWVQDNYLHDIGYAINITGSNIYCIGNVVEKFWMGAIQPAPGSDVWINWNTSSKVRVTAGGAVHPDHMQFSVSTTSGTGLRVIGNRGWVGELGGVGGYEAQGIFGGRQAAGQTQDDAVIAGNTYVCYAGNTLYLRRFKNAQVYSNTIVADPTLGGLPIFGFNVSDANDCKYNVYNDTQDASPVNPSTFGATNVEVPYASYAASFVDPASLADITAPEVQYANLPGSAAELLTIKAGGPAYVDYDARETSFPWDVTATEPSIYRVGPDVVYVAG
jgi:hypothetical protein